MSDLFPQASTANKSASSRSVAADSVDIVAIPRRLLLWLTYGVAGTLLFPLIYLIEGATRPGYNPWQQAISSLSLGPGGWIQQADFILCGISILWLAFVWRQILKGGACATWYPTVRSIEGMALILVGIFSTDPGYGYPPGTPAGAGNATTGGTLHLVFTILVVNAMSVGLFIIARRFWRNPDFRGWTTFSVICGLLPMIFMPFFVIAQNAHGPFSGYAGLFERLATNADTLWGVIVLTPLWSGRKLMRPNVEKRID